MSNFNFLVFYISEIVVLLIGLMCIFAGGAIFTFLALSIIVGTGYGIIFGVGLRRNNKCQNGLK